MRFFDLTVAGFALGGGGGHFAGYLRRVGFAVEVLFVGVLAGFKLFLPVGAVGAVLFALVGALWDVALDQVFPAALGHAFVHLCIDALGIGQGWGCAWC